MKRRTVRAFPWAGEPWPQIEAWAQQEGFTLQESSPQHRLYRKGGRLLMAPAWTEIHWSHGRLTVEAWVGADAFLVVSLLTGKKPEMGIEAGGLTATVPRRRAREAVNRLLLQLGQAPL